MSTASAKKLRPKYLNLAALLFEIRLPLPGWVSILHRISGALLVFPFAALAAVTCSSRSLSSGGRLRVGPRAISALPLGEARACSSWSGRTATTSAPASASCCSTWTRASSFRPRAAHQLAVLGGEPRADRLSSARSYGEARRRRGALRPARLARAAHHRGDHGGVHADLLLVLVAAAGRSPTRPGRTCSRRAGCAWRRCSSP